ncbi:MAG: hypothetical protein U9Q04_02425 [Campylobacterota bacterium]|nr:hypothetical protein [Campylobacterota bacterium]
MKKNIDILVIPISTPLLMGIYVNDQLIETVSKDGKTSDILPFLFEQLMERYNINNIYYTNGPGSYMSIKVAYIFLKTYSIVKHIPLKAVKGFCFNENSPIKALGKKYFFNDNDDKIIIRVLNEDDVIKDFKLPDNLDISLFDNNSLPSYDLPAVN